MANPDRFVAYFHERADLAERLYREGHRVDAVLIATVALDALANIWVRDCDVKVSGADVRFAEFVHLFAGDPRSRLLAVVFLAEDLRSRGPESLRPVAVRLLARRNALEPATRGPSFGEWPRTELDKEWACLVQEETVLASEEWLAALAKLYTYAALVYRLQRCGVAHCLSRGTRVHDFSETEPDDEICYSSRMKVGNRNHPIALKIGLRVVTGWLRAGTVTFVEKMVAMGKNPADGFDASEESLSRLYKKWPKPR